MMTLIHTNFDDLLDQICKLCRSGVYHRDVNLVNQSVTSQYVTNYVLTPGNARVAAGEPDLQTLGFTIMMSIWSTKQNYFLTSGNARVTSEVLVLLDQICKLWGLPPWITAWCMKDRNHISHMSPMLIKCSNVTSVERDLIQLRIMWQMSIDHLYE